MIERTITWRNSYKPQNWTTFVTHLNQNHKTHKELSNRKKKSAWMRLKSMNTSGLWLKISCGVHVQILMIRTELCFCFCLQDLARWKSLSFLSVLSLFDFPALVFLRRRMSKREYIWSSWTDVSHNGQILTIGIGPLDCVNGCDLFVRRV